MTKYVHIVQAHPVENGEPNLYKVEAEREFDTQEEAQECIQNYNRWAVALGKQAVYYGRVNDATGEIE